MKHPATYRIKHPVCQGYKLVTNGDAMSMLHLPMKSRSGCAILGILDDHA